jgi:hypothetical protein
MLVTIVLLLISKYFINPLEEFFPLSRGISDDIDILTIEI